MKGVVQKLYSHPVWFLGLTCLCIIVIVKGKTVPVAVYEVFDTDSAIKQREKEENKERVQEGIKLYHHDDFQQAYELFQEIKKTSTHDRLIDIYLARCEGKIRSEKD